MFFYSIVMEVMYVSVEKNDSEPSELENRIIRQVEFYFGNAIIQVQFIYIFLLLLNIVFCTFRRY